MKNVEIKIIPVKGFTRQEAFDNIDTFKADIIRGCNATQAWIKAGKPIFGTPNFKRFCLEQLMVKTKCAPGLGCYIVVENAIPNTRSKPCEIVPATNTKGARKYKRVHLISEAVLKKTKKSPEPEIIAIGTPIVSCATLKEANQAMRDLIYETQKDYIIQSIKVPTNSVETYGIFVPSSSAKLGTYIAFGVELN